MFDDIKDTIQDGYYDEKLLEFVNDDEIDFDGITEMLHDELWVDDSVTGNASGSYYCNSYNAKMAVIDNEDLLQDALREFCVEPETITEHFINGDWEYFDVTIRCYILGEVIADVVENWLPQYLKRIIKNA
jgi:hypothetical protein